MFQQENVGDSLCPASAVLTNTNYFVATAYKSDLKTGKQIPAHVDTLWEVEVKTAAPVRNTQETPLSQSLDAVLEVQLLMKGLLDLRRQDV